VGSGKETLHCTGSYIDIRDGRYVLPNGLSHHGATMVLVGGKRGGTDQVDDYVARVLSPWDAEEKQ
jgi:hypothetical protein